MRCLVAIVLCAASSRCRVQRRLTIRSNPGNHRGRWCTSTTTKSAPRESPTHYVYYGTRKIRLVKDGYETLKPCGPAPPRGIVEFPGLDFFSENVNPREIRGTSGLSTSNCSRK